MSVRHTHGSMTVFIRSSTVDVIYWCVCQCRLYSCNQVQYVVEYISEICEKHLYPYLLCEKLPSVCALTTSRCTALRCLSCMGIDCQASECKAGQLY